MNILIARSMSEGNLWLDRLHTERAFWLVLNCIGIPETIRGYRPDAIFITPMAAHWLAENAHAGWMTELRNRAPTFTISD